MVAAQEGSVGMSPEMAFSSLNDATFQFFFFFLKSKPLVIRVAPTRWLMLIGPCFLLGPSHVQTSHVFSCACAVLLH